MEPQKIQVQTKSDVQQIVDLATTIIGLLVLAYTLNPEPFDNLRDRLLARAERWLHRASVWDAIRAIRSLPETD